MAIFKYSARIVYTSCYAKKYSIRYFGGILQIRGAECAQMTKYFSDIFSPLRSFCNNIGIDDIHIITKRETQTFIDYGFLRSADGYAFNSVHSVHPVHSVHSDHSVHPVHSVHSDINEQNERILTFGYSVPKNSDCRRYTLIVVRNNIILSEITYILVGDNCHIVFVKTRNENRNCGYATRLLLHLINEKKYTITLYDASERARLPNNIYIQLGFIYLDDSCNMLLPQ
jgi:hypothetical protein